ncbi:DNA cytosine methyltransferase [Flavobacteriaceae bacterium]|nr:DNA cytosine methyltransferase [Flavobacteriaceae bacterium]
MKKKLNFIDLFSGAGGLSEGFIRQGFNAIAHVEIDKAACNTLLTRTAYHYLNSRNEKEDYLNYLRREISRDKLYSLLPENLMNSVINKPIGSETNQDIFELIDKLKGKKDIDLIVGGPPCQAYSLIGRAADKNGMKEDDRNYLYMQYGEYLKKYQPKLFVFENVLGLLSAKSKTGEKYIDKMLKLFKKIGYETEFKTLNANDFGVLQKRKRVILIGSKGNKTDFYPEFLKKETTITVNEIFKGLPKLKAGTGEFYITPYTKETSEYLQSSKIQNGIDFTTQHVARPHNEQDKEIYRIAINKWDKKKERLNYNDLPDRLKTHKNRNSFTDRFKVVADELSSCHTVVAHIAKDGHYYIHPDIKQNRSITPREAARLQSFPDDYFFEGVSDKPSRTAAFKQIGNAVPPLLAEEIAIEIKKLI